MEAMADDQERAKFQEGMRELPPDVKALITPVQGRCQPGDSGGHSGDTRAFEIRTHI